MTVRWLVALVCAVGLGGERLLPQEHVHRHPAEAADDHHAGTEIHRHFAPHHATHQHTHLAAAEDNAEPIDTVYLRTARVTHAFAVAVVAIAALAAVPDVTPGTWVRTDVSLSSHDPPWDVRTPRGPPL